MDRNYKYYQDELDRYLNLNENKFEDKVICYANIFINKIKNNFLLKEYFDSNLISIYSFISELLKNSQHKFNTIGDEELTEYEINQIIGSVILNDEILKLMLSNEIFINGLNSNNKIVYDLSDKSINYFKLKYGVNLNKKFSFDDIIIINVNNNEENNLFSLN
jgi:hypothetical protein